MIVDQTAVADFDKLTDEEIKRAASLKVLVRHASVGENISSGLDSLAGNNSKYSPSNWFFQNRGNPGWQAKVDDLVNQASIQSSNFDVLTMKFCYIDTTADWEYYRNQMEKLSTTHPSKTFIWWTMPIMTSSDNARNLFNEKVRAYANTHNIILFDIAAIESHDSTGRAAMEKGEAMSVDYSTDGGHLNTLGSERVAKAWWMLVARLI